MSNRIKIQKDGEDEDLDVSKLGDNEFYIITKDGTEKIDGNKINPISNLDGNKDLIIPNALYLPEGINKVNFKDFSGWLLEKRKNEKNIEQFIAVKYEKGIEKDSLWLKVQQKQTKKGKSIDIQKAHKIMVANTKYAIDNHPKLAKQIDVIGIDEPSALGKQIKSEPKKTTKKSNKPKKSSVKSKKRLNKKDKQQRNLLIYYFLSSIDDFEENASDEIVSFAKENLGFNIQSDTLGKAVDELLESVPYYEIIKSIGDKSFSVNGWDSQAGVMGCIINIDKLHMEFSWYCPYNRYTNILITEIGDEQEYYKNSDKAEKFALLLKENWDYGTMNIIDIKEYKDIQTESINGKAIIFDYEVSENLILPKTLLDNVKEWKKINKIGMVCLIDGEYLEYLDIGIHFLNHIELEDYENSPISRSMYKLKNLARYYADEYSIKDNPKFDKYDTWFTYSWFNGHLIFPDQPLIENEFTLFGKGFNIKNDQWEGRTCIQINTYLDTPKKSEWAFDNQLEFYDINRRIGLDFDQSNSWDKKISISDKLFIQTYQSSQLEEIDKKTLENEVKREKLKLSISQSDFHNLDVDFYERKTELDKEGKIILEKYLFSIKMFSWIGYENDKKELIGSKRATYLIYMKEKPELSEFTQEERRKKYKMSLLSKKEIKNIEKEEKKKKKRKSDYNPEFTWIEDVNKLTNREVILDYMDNNNDYYTSIKEYNNYGHIFGYWDKETNRTIFVIVFLTEDTINDDLESNTFVNGIDNKVIIINLEDERQKGSVYWNILKEYYKETSFEEYDDGRITYEKGQTKEIPKGKNLYLGTQIEDIEPKGFSHISEIEKTIEQIFEDLDKKIYGSKTAYKMLQRLRRLALIVRRSNRGEFNTNNKKKEAISIINQAIERLNNQEGKEYQMIEFSE